PHFGSFRRLSRSFLKSALSDNGFSAEEFLIPESVTVRRAGRKLEKNDVLSALQAFCLDQKIDDEVADCFTSDLAVPDDVTVPNGILELYVKNAIYDKALRRERILFASRAFPNLNSFEISLNDILPNQFSKSTVNFRQNKKDKSQALVLPN